MQGLKAAASTAPASKHFLTLAIDCNAGMLSSFLVVRARLRHLVPILAEPVTGSVSDIHDMIGAARDVDRDANPALTGAAIGTAARPHVSGRTHFLTRKSEVAGNDFER